MSVQAVLFDCDGVLVDSEPAAFALLRDDFAAHGLFPDAEAMERLFTGGTIEKLREVANGLGADLGPEWVDDFYGRLYARLRLGTALMPGVEALLERLDAAGIAYAVGSNGRQAKMAATLGQHPAVWARLRDRLFSGQELGCPKPDPGLYLHAAAFLGVSPRNCVVIEDSATGARAAVAAGMRCLGYAPQGAPQGAPPGLAALGIEIFADMAEVPRLIGLPG